MSRRMSCSMTVSAVRDRSKTVTRRHVDTWQTLKAGDRLTLIEKGMGLPKGARQVVLAEVQIFSVRVEPIGMVAFSVSGRRDEPAREGLPEMSSWEFVEFWLRGHGHRSEAVALKSGRLNRTPIPGSVINVPCRRIEWEYL